MKNILTKRQKELLSIIYNYIKNTGYPPSYEEMREELAVSSNQSIKDLLNKLVKINVLRKEEGLARGLSILPLGYKLLEVSPWAPFAGTTAAGLPVEMAEMQGKF